MHVEWSEIIKYGLMIFNGLILPLAILQFNLWKRQVSLEQKQKLIDVKIGNLPDQKSYEKLLILIQEIKGEIKANRAESAANFKNLDKHIDKINNTLDRHEDYANTGGKK